MFIKINRKIILWSTTSMEWKRLIITTKYAALPIMIILVNQTKRKPNSLSRKNIKLSCGRSRISAISNWTSLQQAVGDDQ